MDKMDKNTIIQYDNGYLSKTPIFQFILLSCLFPLWAAAATSRLDSRGGLALGFAAPGAAAGSFSLTSSPAPVQ